MFSLKCFIVPAPNCFLSTETGGLKKTNCYLWQGVDGHVVVVVAVVDHFLP